MAKLALLSLLLGYVTCELVGAMKYLPHSATRDAITDAFALPGALLSVPFFPQGIHSATGGQYWPIVVVLGNIVFYGALWFGVLVLLRRRRRRNTDHV